MSADAADGGPTALVGAILATLLVAGALFALVGAVALARFSDFYKRLHGPTKATTLGVGCTLLASAIYFSVLGEGLSLREALVVLLLFLTAPVSAQMLVKAAFLDGPDRAPPPPPGQGPMSSPKSSQSRGAPPG